MADRNENVGSFLDFSGKTALVAGVLDENSIGWPIAKMLNDGGARIALSIQRKAVRRMMGDIPDQLNNPLITECDVGKDEQVERLFSQVEQEFGHLDYLIHSIAYAPPTSFGQRFINIARRGFRPGHGRQRVFAYHVGPWCFPAHEGPWRVHFGHDLLRRRKGHSWLPVDEYYQSGARQYHQESCL